MNLLPPAPVIVLVPNDAICPLLGTVVDSALETTITFLSLSDDKGLPVSLSVSTPPACAEFAVTVALKAGPEGENVTVFSVLKTN